jgi:5'-nucleotidase
LKRLTILCDMDAIIADLTQKWLDHYNQEHSDAVTKADIKSWHMASNVKIGQSVNDYLYREGFFRDLKPLPGAIPAIVELKKMKHDVIIVSAPSWPGTSATDKISWVREHMPFLNKRDIMLGHHKHLLRGDVFIDDSPDNIRQYRNHWPEHNGIMTIAHPYNEEVKELVNVYADGYQDTQKAWGTLLEAVTNMRMKP